MSRITSTSRSIFPCSNILHDPACFTCLKNRQLFSLNYAFIKIILKKRLLNLMIRRNKICACLPCFGSPCFLYTVPVCSVGAWKHDTLSILLQCEWKVYFIHALHCFSVIEDGTVKYIYIQYWNNVFYCISFI
jgi:hypothetical protein